MTTENNTGTTLIPVDLSTTELNYKAARPGVRKARVVQTSIEPAKKEGKFNLLSILEVDDGGGEIRTVRSYIGTDNKTGLARIWVSAGLSQSDLVNGMDITKLQGRDVVIFLESDFQDDPVNVGQKIERSNLKQFLVPTDQAYSSAA